VHCTDTISVQRESYYETCPDCEETITVSISTIAAADPTASVSNIILDTDAAHVVAEKTICSENDQTQWNLNSGACENKCAPGTRPWWNSDAGECQAPSSASAEATLNTVEAKATLSIFDLMGTGGFIDAGASTTTTTPVPVATNQCPSGEYYSFIKSACVAESSVAASTVPIPVVVVATDEELVAEKAEAAQAVIDNLHTVFGAASITDENSSVDMTTGITTVSSTATDSLTLSTADAMNIFGGGGGGPVTLFTPDASVAVSAETKAQNEVLARMFSGGFSFGGSSGGGGGSIFSIFGRR